VKRGLILALVLVAGAAALFLRPAPSPVPDGALPPQIDRIVVDKSDRRMWLYHRGRPVRSYAIALGFSPEGDKVRQGDGRTPEGVFRIDRRNENSRFHLSLGLDYPQRDDVVRASAGGYDPGGDIFIHGQPNALPGAVTLAGDWTAGCIAVSNAEMAEIWRVTPTGTEVEIRP
jgi:murein L,D-transpeptidase YafK